MRLLTMTRLMAVAAFAVGALAGCGGGGGSSSGSTQTSSNGPPTGYLIDAPVQGVSYTTSSGLSGFTALDGSFQYAAGDSVTFTALGIPLGSAVPVPSNGIVTPATITGSPATSATTTAIAQYLQTLALVSTATGTSTASGNLAMPVGNSALQTALAGLGTTNIPTIVSDLQTVLNNVLGPNVVTVVPGATASANLQTGIQAAASAAANPGYINTVWTVTCTSGCGGATIVLLGNGTVAGLTSTGKIVFGTWIVNSGAITFNLGSGGGSATGTLPAGQTSCASCITVASTNGSQSPASLSEVTASNGATTTTDSGFWYMFISPNSIGASNGFQSTNIAVLIALPNGSFLATNGGGNVLSGSWTTSGFSLSWVDGSGNTYVINGNFSTGSGTATKNGTTIATVSVSTTGPSLTMVSAPITIHWANTFTGPGGAPPAGCGDCNPGVVFSFTSNANAGTLVQNYTNPFNNGNGGAPGQGTPTTLSSTFRDTFVPSGTYSYTISINTSSGSQTSAMSACSVTGGASGTFTTSSTQSQATLAAITVTCNN